MTPPSSAFKKGNKKTEPPLTAVVILDTFDQRFAPLLESYPCFATFPVCNVPVVNFTLSWLMRTEVKVVILVVTGVNASHAEDIRKEWKMAFEELNVVVCDGATSVGDCMREINNKELITSDFLLVTNPTCVVSSSLSTQINEYRKRRRENADNVMTLLYSHRQNPEKAVIGVNSTTDKLMLFPAANSINQLKAERNDFYEGVVIRRDITNTGIAFCSRLIATQFSDNFDFVCLDDVVREVLSKDDILGMSIHVDVMPAKERAFYAYDYESLLLLNTLLLERWFYPLVPETADPSRYFTANPRNLYREEDANQIIIKAKTWILSDLSSTVCIGIKTSVAYDAVVNNSCIGGFTSIGSKTRIINCLIGRNCEIGSNCLIENVFIGDSVKIPDGVHIPSESVIANGVVYPKELPAFTSSAIYREAADEEKFDKISAQKIGSIYVAKLRYSAPFWRRSVNGRTNFAVEEADSELSGSDDEEEDDGIDNSVKQFHDEVLESMQKILESEDQPMRNLILEINSSKLACNVTMDDVAKNVFAAFLKLEGNDQLVTLFALVKKWRPLFLNYYKSSDEAMAAKSPAQRIVERDLKKKCQIQLLMALEEKFDVDPDGFGRKVAKIVHFLFNDADVLDEEPILVWAETIISEQLQNLIKPIVDWLKEEDEDEEEEEDE